MRFTTVFRQENRRGHLICPILNIHGHSCLRGVKRNNRVFIIPLFLFEHFRYSIIPEKKELIVPLKNSTFSGRQIDYSKGNRYSATQNLRYSYFIIPLHPPIV